MPQLIVKIFNYYNVVWLYMKSVHKLKQSQKGNELINFYKLMVKKEYSNENFNAYRLKSCLKNFFMVI